MCAKTMCAEARIHPTADVEDGALVAAGTVVWRRAHVRAGARIGTGCTIGRGVFVDEGVCLGDRVKVQNDALLYGPARIGDGAFVGPGAVLTNDLYPRAVNVDGTSKCADDWSAVGVVLGAGCSVGARAVLLPGVTVGRWAMIAAGAVVTADVRAFALVAGVPARERGWVGRAGRPLTPLGGGCFRCPVTQEKYVENPDGLTLKDESCSHRSSFRYIDPRSSEGSAEACSR